MTTIEKLIKEIDKLSDDKIEAIYKLLNNIKAARSKEKKLKTYELGGKFDNLDIRKIAYEKNSDWYECINLFYRSKFTSSPKSFNLVTSHDFDLFITSKNISEFLAVTTREIPYSLNIDEILESIEFFISSFSLLFPNNSSFDIFKKLISKYKPKGNKIHDFEIASISLANEVDIIATLNTKDFKELKEINLMKL